MAHVRQNREHPKSETEPTQNSALGAGYQPTQANTGGRRGTAAKAAGPDEEYTAIFHDSEAARSSTVVFHGRLWQTGQEIGISVIAALAMLEGVVKRGETLKPPLYLRIVISHFGNACERLVIRGDAKLCVPKVASNAFDGPDSASSFQVRRNPVPLRIEGSAADVSDGPHGATRLFLFKRSPETVDARVAVHTEGAGAVGHGVLVEKDQNWCSGKLGEDFAHDYFYGWRELTLDSRPEEGGNQADPLDQVTQEIAIVPYTAQEVAHLHDIPRHGHFDQGGKFVRVRTNTGGRNRVAQTLSICGPEAGLRARTLRLCLRRSSKNVRIVLTSAVG